MMTRTADAGFTEALVQAQRQAVHEYRHRLIREAQTRFSSSRVSTTIMKDELLPWLSCVSIATCCAPRGVRVIHNEPVIDRLPSDDLASCASPSSEASTPSPEQASPEGIRRTGVPPPPPLPRTGWSSAVAVYQRSVGCQTERVASSNNKVQEGAATGDGLLPAPAAVHGLEKELLALRADVASAETVRSQLTTRVDELEKEVEALQRQAATTSTGGGGAQLQPAPPPTACGAMSGAMAMLLVSAEMPQLQPTSSSSSSSPSYSQVPRNSNPSLAAARRSAAPPLPNGGSADTARSTASTGRMSAPTSSRLHGNARARVVQALREVRSKLAVVRTGVRSLGAGELFTHALSLLQPVLSQHTQQCRRLAERAEFFEKTAQGMQAKLLSLPDAESPEGYEVQQTNDGRCTALQLDTKTWNEFTSAFLATIDNKFTKVDDFSQRGARSLLRAVATEREMKRNVVSCEVRCGELESIAVEWECLAIAVATDALLESVAVQTSRKMEFHTLYKHLSDCNDEVRVVSGVSGWFARPSARAKATVWREKRADGLNRLEQLLTQELQHFMMNGSQRNSLRRKVLLLRELATLLQRLRTDVEIFSAQTGGALAPVPSSTATATTPGTATQAHAGSSVPGPIAAAAGNAVGGMIVSGQGAAGSTTSSSGNGGARTAGGAPPRGSRTSNSDAGLKRQVGSRGPRPGPASTAGPARGGGTGSGVASTSGSTPLTSSGLPPVRSGSNTPSNASNDEPTPGTGAGLGSLSGSTVGTLPAVNGASPRGPNGGHDVS